MSLRNPERGLLSVKRPHFYPWSDRFLHLCRCDLWHYEYSDLANSFGVDVGSSFSSFFVILKDYERRCASPFSGES